MNSAVYFLAESENLKLNKNLQHLNFRMAVADLRGYEGRAPPGSKFFQFHAVFGKVLQNRMLAPPP